MIIRKRTFYALLWMAFSATMAMPGFLYAQSIKKQVQQYRLTHEKEILQEFIALLSIPNVASDSTNIRKNASHIISLLQQRGVKAQLLNVPGSPPVVFGELSAPDARHTVMLYAHYDGQPVNPKQWASDPWKPILRDNMPDQGGKEIPFKKAPGPFPGDWRIYARSASDDKAPIIAILTALDALQSAQMPLSVNVKFFFEGEEEAGSPHIQAMLQKYKELLAADVWLLCDGPVHQTRKKQLFFGARGITGVDMTTYGAVRPLHSGHYGNWAPNPISQLINLLASMRDIDGHILIRDFYADVRPITPSEREALNEAPNLEKQLKAELGLGWTEGKGKRLEELIMQPAINFKGIQSGQVGGRARNAIQTEATANVGFRLVPNQTPEKVRERVEAHIRQQGFYIVQRTPTMKMRLQHGKIIRLAWEKGYPPARTSMDLPVSRALVRVLQEATGEKIIRLPTTGGSIPMYLFQKILHAPVILVPIVNHDNNQHAENENVRLQNLWDGIEMYAGMLARLGQVW